MQKRRGWFLSLPIIGMLTHGGNGVPQYGKVRKGFRLVLGLAQQGSGVEGTHEQDAALLNDLSVFPGDGKILPDHPLGGNAPKADHDLGMQQPELLPQATVIQASLSAGSGSRFWGGRHLTMLAI